MRRTAARPIIRRIDPNAKKGIDGVGERREALRIILRDSIVPLLKWVTRGVQSSNPALNHDVDTSRRHPRPSGCSHCAGGNSAFVCFAFSYSCLPVLSKTKGKAGTTELEPQNPLTQKFTEKEWEALRELRVC